MTQPTSLVYNSINVEVKTSHLPILNQGFLLVVTLLPGILYELEGFTKKTQTTILPKNSNRPTLNHSRIPIGVISTKNRLPLLTNRHSPAAPARNPSGISPTKVSLISIVLVGSLEYCLDQGLDLRFYPRMNLFYQSAGESQRVWEKKQITTKAVQQTLSKTKTSHQVLNIQ